MENNNNDEEQARRVREEAERQLAAAEKANEAHRLETLRELARKAAEEAGKN